MNRLEDCINRFEALLNRFEGSEGSGPVSVSSGETKTSSAPKVRLHKVVKEYDATMNPLLEKFSALGEKHSNKLVQEATVFAKDMFTLIRTIIYSITMSKPTKVDQLASVISPKIKDLDNKIGKKLRGMELKNHCKVLLDGLQLIQLAIMDDPHDIGKEYLAQIDFFGNKILTSGKEQDVEWYKAYKPGLCLSYFKFLSEAYDGALPFSSSGGEFATVFAASLAEATGEKKSAEPKEEAKTEVKDTSKPAKTAAKPKQEPKKRQPQKTQRGKLWDVCFYENETLEFTDEGIMKDYSYMITNCMTTNIIIKGKFNNISLNGCKNCAVIVDTVISSAEFINCEDIKLQINLKCSQVTVDKCKGVEVFLNEDSINTQVTTTNSTKTFFNFPLKEPDENDNDQGCLPVPETYATKIVDGKLVTTIVDLSE